MTNKFESYSATRITSTFKPLAQQLPLSTPLSLMVDPTNACNFKCVFCPTGDTNLLTSVGRKVATMPFSLFQRIVDGVNMFPERIRVLHLYKDGEPFANPSIFQMIEYAKVSDCFERVETTSNASLLTFDKAKSLVDSGLDGIRFSIYATSDEDYRNISRTSKKFEEIYNNISGLYSYKSSTKSTLHIHCKIVDTGLSSEQKSFFLSAFGPISDSIHIDSIQGWSNTSDRDMTLGLDPDKGMTGSKRKDSRMVCPEPFMKLAVNSDGSVSVCCADWSHATVVGDVSKESLFDIWNGTELRVFRTKHLEGNKNSIPACSSCHYMTGLPEYSDLDAHAVDLLQYYK